MITGKQITKRNYHHLLDRIGEILHQARAHVVREINKTQVLAYYEIGREIVEFEQKGKARAGYGEELIRRLSKDMTEKFGKGFSEINLRNMRRFYLEFPKQIQQTLSVKSPIRKTLSAKFEPVLSWSHYCELLKEDTPLARSFYEKEAAQSNWSVRELKRQMNFYLNYFKDKEKSEGENDPIGLILCAKKNDIFAKYVLGNLSNKVFAARYKLALPSEKELRARLKVI